MCNNKNEEPQQTNTEETIVQPEEKELNKVGLGHGNLAAMLLREETSIVKFYTNKEVIADLKDKLLRQVADFTNYRRQQQKNIADLILNGGVKVIESLLPILDDMERAQQNIASSDDIATAREGLDMIFSKLQNTLGKHGLKKMETADMAFDTDFHEAVAILPMGEDKKGLIIDTVQAGYLMNDKVLRHAKVVVGQ